MASVADLLAALPRHFSAIAPTAAAASQASEAAGRLFTLTRTGAALAGQALPER